ncbi:MAG: TetR family transcriptional regulator [Desulforhabdus sp.]|nr:TetR family transcriptional regulator [Desulforhabdus sp.]
MARRTRQEAEQTRQDILRAAFDIFSRKGFMRTTLSNVASAAGVTRGAIYWHFKDKLDLFLALAEEIEAAAAVRPDDLEKLLVQSLDDLKREVLNFLAHFEKNDRYAIFYEMVNHNTEYTEELEPVRTRQREVQREFLRTVEEVFGQLRSRGAVRTDLDPSHAALSLIAFVVGLIDIWLSDRQSFCITEVASVLMDDFFRGMRGTD